MAAQVTVSRSNANGQQILSAVISRKEFDKAIVKLYNEMAIAIEAGNGGAANLATIYGFGDGTEAQAFFDRTNAYVAQVQGTAGTPWTLAEYISAKDELVNAVFAV